MTHESGYTFILCISVTEAEVFINLFYVKLMNEFRYFYGQFKMI